MRSNGRMLKYRSPSMYGPKRSRSSSPLMLVGIMVTFLIVLGAGAFLVTRPHAGTHAAGAQQVNMDCTLIAPPGNFLTAQGLAQPWQLTATNPANGPCNQQNANQTAFIQGAIFNPANGQISIYNPVVVDKGTQPAAAPVVPTLPQGAIVALWGGFNGNNVTLQGTNRNLRQARCVNGLGNSVFGQFWYCNAPAFFQAANRAIRAGQLAIPPLGMGNDGQPCPTVRSFRHVDMDQSDNVDTQYLVTADGRTAQNTAANAAALQGAKVIGNPSDNALLKFVDAALGCKLWMAPDLANAGNMVPALPLDELQAAAMQAAPVATVPLADPMVLNNNQPSLIKTILYRLGVDQPLANMNNANTKTYCMNLLATQPAALNLDKQFTNAAASPAPAVASTLFNFLSQRLMATLGPNGLNCTGLLNVANPVTVQTDGNGVVVNATITVNGTANNGGNTAMATLTVNGTAAQFTNGQAQVTINKQPATATVNGTAISITDGANNQNGNNGQQNNGQNNAQANNGQNNGQNANNGVATAPVTLTVNGTAVQFTNGQAQVTINKQPATATVNGTAITITDGANNQNGNNGGNNGGANQGGNNGGTATTGINFNINGTVLVVSKGQSVTVTINNQPVTLTLSADGTMVTITNANNGGANSTVNIPANNNMGPTTMMVNQQPTTMTMNGNTMSITNGNAAGNGATPAASATAGTGS